MASTSRNNEITTPLLQQQHSAVSESEEPGIYSSAATAREHVVKEHENQRYGGFGEFIRRMLGIYSYRDPTLMNKPRKIPMRVEPKTYLALERTFLNWLSMSVTIATLGTTLLGFSAFKTTEVTDEAFLSPRVLSLITCLLLPFGMLLLGYSIFIYDQRLSALKAKEMRYFEDKLSPVVICFFIITTLTALFVARAVEIYHSFQD
mmetsp:Transcript_39182/g.100109  ORF Transcript_39182/g.100109 Transcript_39182/m.100109 type:complete len:205 (-) Transcript_39182:235-849(-)